MHGFNCRDILNNNKTAVGIMPAAVLLEFYSSAQPQHLVLRMWDSAHRHKLLIKP
ncbi:MAG: hypothetical protein RSA78_06105 [Oscillospiraceae bacterium]